MQQGRTGGPGGSEVREHADELVTLLAFDRDEGMPIGRRDGRARDQDRECRDADQALHRGVADQVPQRAAPVIAGHDQIRARIRGGAVKGPEGVADRHLPAKARRAARTGLPAQEVLGFRHATLEDVPGEAIVDRVHHQEFGAGGRCDRACPFQSQRAPLREIRHRRDRLHPSTASFSLLRLRNSSSRSAICLAAEVAASSNG
ncbi:MAG: hypothetical protein M5U07_19475 [Xanthobacteraceae bacterium]|nr:hypothetical protein [Xanthobacteraceae bacterium]